MWAIKFLSGPCVGKEFLLQDGLVVLGRDETCEVPIPSKSVSKKHAQIVVKGDGITIEDLNSSNGVFYKTKKIKTQKLKEGDRIALHNIIFEVQKKSQPMVHPYFQQVGQQNSLQNDYTQNQTKDPINQTKKKELDFDNIQKGFKGYINNVVLPGVYKLAEWMEFKWLVGGFVVIFIFSVVTLSSVPLIQILKSSVEQEGKNHAESIAVTLAKLNQKPLRTGLNAGLTVDYAQRRPGVEKAYIISALDGRILAPAELAQTYPKIPFIHKARRVEVNSIKKLGNSKIAAVVPISFYSPESGKNVPVAYSVVLYDIGSLSVSGVKVFSLLTQNLFIACILGLILFFFLINLIEFPIRSISHQLNESLKDSTASSVSTLYQSKILSELCDHINSALNQISLNQMLNKNDGADDSSNKSIANKHNEMTNLVEIVGFPSLSVDLETETVSATNSNFSEQLGYSEILNSSIADIQDNDLRQHLEMLLKQGQASPEEISFGEIVLNNMSIQTACQFIMGQNKPAYAIVIFMPAQEGQVA